MNGGSVNDMKRASAKAASLMRALAHDGRLLVLCALCDREHSVGALAEITGLSASALSQHLAKLRAEGFVATRRNAQTVYYRLQDPTVRSVIDILYKNFCPA